MSNYLRHLLIMKQLDITTNPEKPEKQCMPRYFHPILKEGEDESKKIQIKPYHICVVGTHSWLCLVIAYKIYLGCYILLSMIRSLMFDFMTAHESRLTRWYHSPCTIGPNLKPICLNGCNTPFSCYIT